MKDTNPDHYKVDGADFVKFMDDPQIKGFGDWMFANGYNTGELYVNRWISVKERLPIEKENPLTHDFAEVICFCDFGGLPRRTDIRMYKFGKPSWETKPHFWHGPQNMDGIVTHWMPLPEPPEEN